MKNVLLIDSGSGGINILKECVKVCPYCNFLLFCDDKNLPYGNKSKKELQEITLQNLKNIQQFFDFDIAILACNTLTCTCLDFLRQTFSDKIFIGTVPPVKPALEKFAPQDILVLATEATLKHNVLINKNPALQTHAFSWLAGEIDSHLDELHILKQNLEKELNIFRPKAVVLGCTHYLAVKEQFGEIFGTKTEFFDSANGVARRLRHFVIEENLCEDEKIPKKDLTPSFQVQIMVSGQPSKLASFWWWYEKE